MCVIVDEAYCEFNLLEDPDASIDLLERHPNLVLLRTFSKVHGLVRAARRLRAVRLGASCRARSTRCASRSSATPLAQAAAVEALAHQDEVIDRVTRTVAERIAMDEGLRALGLGRAESQANFCWVHLGERARRGRGRATACASAACSCAPAPRSAPREPALRVTYGLPEENERFLAGPRRGARRRARTLSRALPPRAATSATARWTGGQMSATKLGRITMHQTAREYQRIAASAVWSSSYAWRFS